MNDVGAMLQEAAQSLPPLQDFVFICAGVLGVFSVIFALTGHFTEARRGTSPYGKTLMGLFIGSLLLSLPTVMEVFSTSLFGSAGSPKIVTNSNLTSTDSVRRTLHAITLYISVVGWIAGARGLWVYKTGPQYQEQGWFFKGTVLLVAGSCATNFALFVDILANTVNADALGTMYFTY